MAIDRDAPHSGPTASRGVGGTVPPWARMVLRALGWVIGLAAGGLAALLLVIAVALAVA